MKVSSIMKLAIDELGRAPGVDMKVWSIVRDSVPLAQAQEAVVEAAREYAEKRDKYGTCYGEKLVATIRRLDGTGEGEMSDFAVGDIVMLENYHLAEVVEVFKRSCRVKVPEGTLVLPKHELFLYESKQRG